MENLISEADVKNPFADSSGLQVEEPDTTLSDNNIKNNLTTPQDLEKTAIKKYYPDVPPVAEQGWYKKINNVNVAHDLPGATLNDAAIYSIVAHNPLQRPDEIVIQKPKPQPVFTPPPMTNPMPRRTRMYAYNPYQQMRGMY